MDKNINNVDEYVSEEGSYEGKEDYYDDDSFKDNCDYFEVDLDERHLFVFKFVNLSGKNKSGLEILKMDQEDEKIFLASISYVQVLKLAVKCQEICQAWEVRRDKIRKSDQESEINSGMARDLGDEDVNFYQTELSVRRYVRDYSIYRLIEVLGDEPEVKKFFNKISTSVNLLKSAIFMIIRNCLPPMISFTSPVVSRVLEYSIANEYLDNIGLVSQEGTRQLVEVKYLMKLYEDLGSVYNFMRDMMFRANLREEKIVHYRRHIFRAQVHVMGTFLEEEIDLEDGGWVSNSSWEEDVDQINSDIDTARKMFKLSTCIFN